MKTFAPRALCTSIAAVVLLACRGSAFAAEPAIRPSESRRTVPALGLMLNDDGDRSAASDDPDESARLLREAVDSLAGTKVETLLWCVGCGSDVLYYPTKVASCVGWQSPDAMGFVQLARARRMIEAGHEPLRVVGEQAKRQGLKFFPSYRMNDAHFAGKGPEKSALTGEFWYKHHAMLSFAAGSLSEAAGIHNLLSYAHSEVRAHRVAIVLEVLDRYADTIDGIELDFTRHPILYKHGQGREHFDYVTAMVRQVREKLDAMSVANGRQFHLLVRTPPTLEDCPWIGLDVGRWIDDRLVDVVTISHTYSTVLELPAHDWSARCRAANVPLYVTIFPRSDYTNCYATADDGPMSAFASAPGNAASLDFIRAAVANYRSMGVDGFEMFNIFLPLSPYARDVQRILGEPDAALDGNRLYAITRSNMDLWGLKQHKSQLPRTLAVGTPESFTIFLGETFAASRSNESDRGRLRLSFDGINPGTELQVNVNGKIVHDGPVGTQLIAINADKETQSKHPRLPTSFVQFAIKDLTALCHGQNTVTVECTSRESANVELIDVQIALLSGDGN